MRIGLHAGEPVVEATDLFGTAVQVAGRLSDAAEPGAILATRKLCDGAGAEVEATLLGPVELKGFAAPVPVFSIAWQ